MYTRICPICKRDVHHTNKYNGKRLEGQPCQQCGIKQYYNTPSQFHNTCEMCGDVVSIRYESKVKNNWKCEKCRYKIEKNCVICGTKFLTRKYENGNTCSHKCMFTFIAQNMGGPNVTNVSQLDEIKKKKEGKAWFSLRSMAGKNNPMYGKHHSVSTKEKIGNANAGNGHPHTAKTRRTLRLAAIKRIENRVGQIQPNYNSQACQMIDEYGKQHGYNFQHAENGGEYHIKELGYWLDGYDKEKNIVIEYDELRHQSSKQKRKDAVRQQEIEKHLGCKFIRLIEQTNGTYTILLGV